jgi:hypothetical protein
MGVFGFERGREQSGSEGEKILRVGRVFKRRYAFDTYQVQEDES